MVFTHSFPSLILSFLLFHHDLHLVHEENKSSNNCPLNFLPYYLIEYWEISDYLYTSLPTLFHRGYEAITTDGLCGAVITDSKCFPTRVTREQLIASCGMVKTSDHWFMEIGLCAKIGTALGEGQVKSPPQVALLVCGTVRAGIFISGLSLS